MGAHPIIGALVTGYFGGQHAVGRVERIVFPRRARAGSFAPFVVVRLHGGPCVNGPGSSWEDVVARYQGRRVEVPVTGLKRVLPGEGEGWVDAADFLEWAES